MTWPDVFDGIGALVVNCAGQDPDVLADRITGLTWVAYKVGGTDVADDADTAHAAIRWEARGLSVGQWIFCTDPALDVSAAVSARIHTPLFVVYDVEQPYKQDEGGNYAYATELVKRHPSYLPAAVTSYGAYKSSIDFGAFAAAGWPVLAQGYDSYTVLDADSYHTQGPYPEAAVYNLVRRTNLWWGEAVYRPESIDG